MTSSPARVVGTKRQSQFAVSRLLTLFSQADDQLNQQILRCEQEQNFRRASVGRHCYQQGRIV